jgi:hypothetical protein
MAMLRDGMRINFENGTVHESTGCFVAFHTQFLIAAFLLAWAPFQSGREPPLPAAKGGAETEGLLRVISDNTFPKAA